MKCNILLLAVAIAAPITDAVRQAVPFMNRIVGGEIAKDGEFPHAIFIRNWANMKCGGSILNKEWILTAGHCVSRYQARFMSIVAGTNNLHHGGVIHNISFTVIHDKFSENEDMVTYDIALAKLATPLVFTPKIQPISLLTSPVPVGSHLVLSGWGTTRWPSDDPSEQLLYLEVVSIDLEQCRHRFDKLKQYEPDETMLCGVQEYGRGACPGDSGSALVYNGRIAGIVSWLEPCGVGYPDAYTNVPFFVDWIQEKINKY